MKKRRRRFRREETIAPWLTAAVILGLWWTGAYLVGRDAEPTPPGITVPGAQGAPSAHGAEGASGAQDAPSAEGAQGAPSVAGAARVSGAQGVSGASAVSGDAADQIARASELGDVLGEGPGPIIPVSGIDKSSLRSSFDEIRGGTRRHEAMDILAPRGTPVVAAVGGRIAKLFTSAAGGLTIYQFDAEERFCYYYAHLEAYAPDLNEGETVSRGQLIGYVGTTGNAPPDTPHLHFAIYRLGPDKNWWDGEPIDPYGVIR